MYSNNNKRIAKNTLFLYFRMLLIMLVTLYTSRVVLQVLGIEDFGIYNVVGGFVSMLSFLNTSVANGFQRFFNLELGKERFDNVKRLFSVSLFIQIIISFFILILAETIGLWFLNVKMNIEPDRIVAANWVYQCSVLMLVVMMFRAPYDAIIIAYEKMSFYAYTSICEVICRLLLVYFLAIMPYDSLKSYGVLMLVVTIVIFICYVFFVNNKFKSVSLKPVFDMKLMKQMLGFSGWNLLGSLAHLMKSQGVNVLLNIFFGPAVNAARGISYQIQSGISMFVSNFQLAARPQMIKSYAVENLTNLMVLFYRISKFSFFLLWLLSLPLLLKMDFVLRLWLGTNIPSLSSKFAILALLISLVESFATPITTIVHATGRMRRFQIICSCIILCIVPVSYFVLNQNFLPESVMYVSLIIAILVHGVRMILLKGLIEFSIKRYIVKVLYPCIGIVIISLIFAFGINYYSGEIVFSVFQMVFTSLFTLALIYLIGLDRNEKRFVKNVLIRCYKKI